MPIVISLDGFLIQTARLALIVFAIVTIWLISLCGKRRHLNDGVLGRTVERTILAGVLGARIAFVAENFSAYRKHLLSALYLWQSGYMLWAGFLSVVAYLGWAAWRRKISFPQFRLVGIIGLPMLLAYWTVLATLGQFAPADRLRAGAALPNFEFVDLNGQGVNLNGLRGRPAVVNIWATWCLPCREEMPLLSRIFAKQRKNGVAFVGVDLAEPARRVRRFLNQMPVSYPIWVDAATANGPKDQSSSMKLFRRTGGFAVPTTLFVNSKGVISSIYLGKLTAAIVAIKLGAIGSRPPLVSTRRPLSSG